MIASIFKYLSNLFRQSANVPAHESSHAHQTLHQQQHKPHKPSAIGPDLNQVNQLNEYFLDLRARANQEGEAMSKCFEQSHLAYASGDKAGAATLSKRGKEHQRKMESLNNMASEWIFVENNKDSQLGEVDLHGLYVKEAIERAEKAIEEAKNRGDNEIRFIVGKGLHSKGGHSKIKPAIEELMHKYNY